MGQTRYRLVITSEMTIRLTPIAIKDDKTGLRIIPELLHHFTLNMKTKNKKVSVHSSLSTQAAESVNYIWLDAEGEIRYKTRVIPWDNGDIPTWSFDGGSTGHASEDNSDCLLEPVRVFRGYGRDPLVLCTVTDSLGIPHASDWRSTLSFSVNTDKLKVVLGVEQEYTYLTYKGVNTKPEVHDNPVDNFYCKRTYGEEIAKEHAELCLSYGLPYRGYNSEVTQYQWEYQLGPFNSEYDLTDPLVLADCLIISRYLLDKIISEQKEITYATMHPKPFEGLNGAGCHINISTKNTRDGVPLSITYLIGKLAETHTELMSSYGEDNELRLIGKNETSNYHDFTSGNSSRNTSVRIPNSGSGETTYFEDRRPAANINPYRAFSCLINILNR